MLCEMSVIFFEFLWENSFGAFWQSWLKNEIAFVLRTASDGHLMSQFGDYMYKFVCTDKFLQGTFSKNCVIY